MVLKKEFWKSVDNERLEILLSEAKDPSVFKYIQAVYLKAAHDMSAEAIGKVLGFSKGYVWAIHSSYRHKGEIAFIAGKRGGDFHRNISFAAEKALLSDIESEGDMGRILDVKKIKNRYEGLAGKPVHKTVIYRMLARHGWRKITPRPHHPKNDKEAVETYKKTSLNWCRMA